MQHNTFVYYWLYKPFQVMSQFSPEGTKETLANYLIDIPKDVYPVGRLDYDSEGLLLLTNDKKITQQLLHPKHQHQKTYWVQVEGAITQEAIQQLCDGVTISINGTKHHTAKAFAHVLEEPIVPERNPPIRFRQNIPTTWISLTITEGKNRQVRKMTAAVGFPTLRLIRHSIGGYNIENLIPGTYLKATTIDSSLLFQTNSVEKKSRNK